MLNVVIILLHDFQQMHRFNYGAQETKNDYDFYLFTSNTNVFMYGITSIPNFIKIITDII